MRRIAVLAVCLLIISASCAENAPVTGILAPMKIEVNDLAGSLKGAKEQTIAGFKFTTGALNGRNVVVAQIGMGKVNSAVGAMLMIEHFKPSEIIVTGIAGALNPSFSPGDIVYSEKVAQHDYGKFTPQGMQPEGTQNPHTDAQNPLLFQASSRLIDLTAIAASKVKLEPMTAGARAPRVTKGVIVCGDVFVADKTKSEWLRKTFNADAVEMEGAAVAQICHQQNVPFIVIRSMSDMANETATIDIEKFCRIAADNSAKLVKELAGQLTARK